MRRIHKSHVPVGSALDSVRKTTMFQPNRVWTRSLWRRGSARVGLLAGLAALGAAAAVAIFHAGAPGTAPVTALDAAPPAPPAVAWETDEIGRMPAVLLLQAGKSLQMDVAPNAAQMQVPVAWKAYLRACDRAAFIPTASAKRLAIIRARRATTRLMGVGRAAFAPIIAPLLTSAYGA